MVEKATCDEIYEAGMYTICCGKSAKEEISSDWGWGESSSGVLKDKWDRDAWEGEGRQSRLDFCLCGI